MNVSKIIVAAFVFLFSGVHAMEPVCINFAQGADCAKCMDYLVDLKIETFREFPYLYIGTQEFEREYIGGYPKNQDSCFALAYVGQELAGILTGTPLQVICDREADILKAFTQLELHIPDYYFFGEVITLEQFRNQGIATKNFEVLEQHARKLGYKHVCFITVEREDTHPLKPENYKGPTSLFIKLGYAKTTMHFVWVWPTLQLDGTVQNVENIVAMWVKNL